jgi:hypothetical protein
MTKKFKKGDIVYTTSGLKHQYVSAGHDNYHIVRPIVEVGGEEYYQDPVLVDCALYADPPSFVWSEEIKAAEKKLAEVSREILVARTELDSIKRAQEDTIKRLKNRGGALARIEAYLEGKFTHFVVTGLSTQLWAEIVEANDLLTIKDDYTRRTFNPKTIKLLSLYGKTNGDLLWKVNRYWDGSGSEFEAVPCTSYEEARVELDKMLQNEWDTAANQWLPKLAATANKYGLPIPKNISATLEVVAAEGRAKEIAALRNKIASAQKALADLEDAKA